MSEDNGNVKFNPGQCQQEGKPPEQLQSVEMKIIAKIGEPVVVHFPFLNDKVATYGFLKLAEKVLDAYYAKIEKSMIQPAKGSMLNFVRKVFS